MTSVDNRVVAMKFDNAAFEAKMSETMRSLDKLKQSLDFQGSAKSMANLSAESKRFDMSHMGSAVEGVSAKFVALATVGITAIQNLTNRVVDAGMAMSKSLTIEPVSTGFGEFELKMGAIQTIMAGSGEDLETVNKQLEVLNQYADKTIYSFGDMTQNIGKFTNAGVSLEDSVAAIKGVANVAALSGASSNEASRAMYNFSQALSAGHVKLIDWKSIELANMGTKEFKEQLIDAAVAQGTLTKKGDAYVTTAGKTLTATKGFNESLTDGWMTSKALTETLGKYSDATTDIGKRATAAAQDVKTFSQMIDTLKEGAGSGWAQSFELIFGNFEEGKKLWTSINGAIGGVIERSAQARNAMLGTWKAFGGRDDAIKAFSNVFEALGRVMAPIKLAFRELFPKKTGKDLLLLTDKFLKFSEKLKIGGDTVVKLKRTFSGFFSIFAIAGEIIREVLGLFSGIGKPVGEAGGKVLDLSEKIGMALVKFREMLVEGGAIKRFFERIKGYVDNPKEALVVLQRAFENFKDKLEDIFNGGDIPGADKFEGSIGRINDRMDSIRKVIAKVVDAWNWMGEKLSGVRKVFNETWDFIHDWFSNLGKRITEGMSSGDFDPAVDMINVGLLGGIALIIRKFMKNGFNIDIGDGIFSKIAGTFDQLTSTLKAMQAKLKADILMKIAVAIGILTASVMVLSLIDSDKLQKALVAMSVGFGQLVGVMAALNYIVASPAAAGKLSTLAFGMALVAGAVVILAIAIRMLSGMSWDELSKGLVGVTVALAAMTASTQLLTKDRKGMIRTGFAMIGIAIAMLILAKAVKSFAEMSWGEMARGLVGVAVGLGAITLAVNLMPTGMIAKAVGLVIIAGALQLLAFAVYRFADIPWAVMGKGFLGIGVGLVVIGGAMRLMPKNMMKNSAALVVLAAALLVISEVVKNFGGMDMGELAKGIGAIAVMLGILAVATNTMTSAVAGALSIVIVAGALTVLADVVQQLGSMKWQEVALGLGAVAGMFAVVGLAALILTPVIPMIAALGASLILIGAGFALFGVGAILIAKAFEAIASAGKKGVEVIIAIIEELIKALPRFIGALGKALIGMVVEILGMGPTLIKAVTAILSQLLDSIVKLVPQIVKVIGSVIQGIIDLIREYGPKWIELGFEMLLALLQGWRDNIEEITTLVTEIITGFLDALGLKVPEIIDSVYNLVTAIISGVIEKLAEVGGKLVPRGMEFIGGLLTGLWQALPGLFDFFTSLPGKIITWVGDTVPKLLGKGIGFITGLLNGIIQKAPEVMSWIIALPGKIIGWIGDTVPKLLEKGKGFITGLLNGLGEKVTDVSDWLIALPGKVVGWVGDVTTTLGHKGRQLIGGMFTGLTERFEGMKRWVTDIPGKVASWIGEQVQKVKDMGEALGDAIIKGLTLGIGNGSATLKNTLGTMADQAVTAARERLDVNSPSKRFMTIGKEVVEGFVLGITKNQKHSNASAGEMADGAVLAFRKNLDKLANLSTGLEDIRPTIAPVLDLSQVEREAQRLGGMMNVSSIRPDVSSITPDGTLARANHISHTTDRRSDPVPASTEPSSVSFVQNIHSPKALSTADIYRNTNSQIALAKEELNIA